MFSPPTVRDNVGGGAVLVKHASGDSRTALRRQSEVLTAAADVPGVVELRGLIELEERSELTLTYVEGVPLDEHPPMGVDVLLAVVLSVARTVADLHDRGIRHGAIGAEHVLVDRHGQVVLCGFGAAAMANGPGCPEVSDDLGGLAALLVGELDRSQEAGLTGLHRREAAEATEATEAVLNRPSPGVLRRWIAQLEVISRSADAVSAGPSGRRRVRRQTQLTRLKGWRLGKVTRLQWVSAGVALLAVVVLWGTFRGGGESPADGVGPTAAGSVTGTFGTPAGGVADGALGVGGGDAGEVASGIAGNAVTGFAEAAGAPTAGLSTESLVGAAEQASGELLGGAADGTASGGLVFAAAPSACPVNPHPDEIAATDGVAEGGATADGTAATGAGVPEAADSGEAEAVAQAGAVHHLVHVDGDGCEDWVTLQPTAAGTEVRAADSTWTVGMPGNLAAVGDWDCDGLASIATLEPDTGQLSVFSWWPNQGTVWPAQTALVPVGATALSARTVPTAQPADGTITGAECDQAVVSYGQLELLVPLAGPSAGQPPQLTVTG